MDNFDELRALVTAALPPTSADRTKILDLLLDTELDSNFRGDFVATDAFGDVFSIEVGFEGEFFAETLHRADGSRPSTRVILERFDLERLAKWIARHLDD